MKIILQKFKLIFLLVLTLCSKQGIRAQITVNSNTTWDLMNLPPTDYKGGILVQGATLEINGFSGLNKLEFDDSVLIAIDSGKLIIQNSEIVMGKNSKILLESACYEELISNNSIFKTANNETWKGIEIGKSNCDNQPGELSQFTIQPTTDNEGNCSQSEWSGILSPTISKVLVNNCKFYNAEKAIFSDGESSSSTGGGVIRSRETEFINCLKSIIISGWDKGDFNASYIMTSDFIWNDSIPTSFNKRNLKFIEFNNLKSSAVRVGGCDFRNEITDLDSFNYRGIGIHSISSDFSISKDGDKCCTDSIRCPDNCFADVQRVSRRNIFIQLGYGILFDGDQNVGSRIDCRNSDFHTCYHGVELNNCIDGIISENNFNVFKASADDFFFPGTSNDIGFVHLTYTSSSGIRIFENVFKSNLDFIVGVKSINPSLIRTSFIRRNTFNNIQSSITALCGPQIRAVDVYGNNDYLDINCNVFLNQVYDVRVNNLASLNDIPDLYVYGLNDTFNRNIWSKVPQNTSSSNYKWLTDGCASNIYVEFGNIKIYDKYKQLGIDNIRFDIGSFQVIQPNIQPFYFRQVGSQDCIGPSSTPGNNNCTDCNINCGMLDVKEVNLMGINNINFSQRNVFTIYPNPANNVFTCEILRKFTLNGLDDLIIFDFQGKKIFETPIYSKITTIDCNKLGMLKGLYYISVLNEGRIIDSMKLVIE